jgi:hypothetical protein
MGTPGRFVKRRKNFRDEVSVKAGQTLNTSYGGQAEFVNAVGNAADGRIFTLLCFSNTCQGGKILSG